MSNQYDEIMYKNNYLSKVIIRIDFLSPIKKIENELPPQISKIIKFNYPVAEPKKVVAEQKTISKDGKIKVFIDEKTEWHFYGKEREKELVIIPTAIFVNYLKYTSYEELKREFQEVLNKYFELFNEAQVSRLGLRYINDISLNENNPLDWGTYLKKDISCLSNFIQEKQSLSRVFSTIEMNYGDFNLRFQFGLFNSDFPAPIKKKSYLLDFDAYYQGLQDQNQVMPNLDKYHTKIQELFEFSITDKLREKLNE
ncbi:MAG: TIGR04255 family protein [Actinomycetia bacterium]|nr:TIGR04255 family protein [Actinomycetes bacterium]